MSESKFDPMKEFSNLRDSISKAVEQSMKSLASNVSGSYPLLDVYETAEAVIIKTAPIAGLDTSTIEVSMENGVLTLSGASLTDPDIPEGTPYLLQERRTGAFTRSIRISTRVKPEAAQARVKEGVLTITLPRQEESRPHIINITPAE